MNPHSLYLNELTEDGSDDDVSSAFRHVLPLWAAAWADSPTSYLSPYWAIVAKVNGLPQSPLQARMLERVVYLAERRPGHPYTAA